MEKVIIVYKVKTQCLVFLLKQFFFISSHQNESHLCLMNTDIADILVTDNVNEIIIAPETSRSTFGTSSNEHMANTFNSPSTSPDCNLNKTEGKNNFAFKYA